MRILLADDQPKVRSALRLFVEQALASQIVGEVDNARTLLPTICRTQPDVVLLDWELPGLPIIKLLADLRHQLPCLDVIILSSRLEAEQAAQQTDATAFISKGQPPEDLLVVLLSIQTKFQNRQQPCQSSHQP